MTKKDWENFFSGWKKIGVWNRVEGRVWALNAFTRSNFSSAPMGKLSVIESA